MPSSLLTGGRQSTRIIFDSAHLLGPLFFEFKQIPLIFFGYASALIFGFTSIGNYLSYWVSEKIGNKSTIILSAFFTSLLLILATMTNLYSAVILFAMGSIFYGIRRPILDHLINLEVSSRKRATTVSILNFMIYLGVAIASPFIGYYAELYTINTAFRISGILMLFSIVIFFFIKNKD